jgi:hypothetical protein
MLSKDIFIMYIETCLNWTLNKPKSSINRTLDTVPMWEIFVNLICIKRTPVYSESTGLSNGGSAFQFSLYLNVYCFYSACSMYNQNGEQYSFNFIRLKQYSFGVFFIWRTVIICYPFKILRVSEWASDSCLMSKWAIMFINIMVGTFYIVFVNIMAGTFYIMFINIMAGTLGKQE